MKKSKLSEEQIVRILKEIDAGANVGSTCRKYGISEPTYYVWKSKFVGMEVSQLRHLKEVEAELSLLKRVALVHIQPGKPPRPPISSDSIARSGPKCSARYVFTLSMKYGV